MNVKLSLFIMLIIGIATNLYACSPGSGTLPEEQPTKQPEVTANPSQNSDTMKIMLIANGTKFTITIHNNETVQALTMLLPMTVTMRELNGNEKYYDLPQSLPGTAAKPGTIQAGDLMFWSSNCLVLFYKTFSTSYSYVRLGRVDNVAGLAEALGTGNVQVGFEILNP